MTTVRILESLVWFVDPISAALTQAAHWWRAVDLVGVYYRGNMAGLNQTTWGATRSATGDNRTDL